MAIYLRPSQLLAACVTAQYRLPKCMGNDYTVANKTASNYGQHISITFWQLPEDYSQEILILLQNRILFTIYSYIW